MSARKVLLDKISELFSEVRGGRYHVYRGRLNFPAWDWSVRPHVASIIVGEDKPFLTDGRSDILLELELVSRNPRRLDIDGIDDGLADEHIEDVERVLNALEDSQDTIGDSVALRVQRDSALGYEMHDPDRTVQGWKTRLIVSY